MTSRQSFFHITTVNIYDRFPLNLIFCKEQWTRGWLKVLYVSFPAAELGFLPGVSVKHFLPEAKTVKINPLNSDILHLFYAELRVVFHYLVL